MVKQVPVPHVSNASILTESEKARLLEEVNAQQADFGLQK